MPTYNSRGLPLYSTSESFPGWASAFNSQSNLLATALDDSDTTNQDNDSVAAFADLPTAGNWVGRNIYVVETESTYRCVGLPAAWTLETKVGQRVEGMRVTGTTDVNGIIVVSYPASFDGAVPTWIQVTCQLSGAGETQSKVIDAIVWDSTLGGSAVQIRFRNEQSNEWMGNNAVAFFITFGLEP